MSQVNFGEWAGLAVKDASRVSPRPDTGTPIENKDGLNAIPVDNGQSVQPTNERTAEYLEKVQQTPQGREVPGSVQPVKTFDELIAMKDPKTGQMYNLYGVDPLSPHYLTTYASAMQCLLQDEDLFRRKWVFGE
jgi:hypothetical protein